MSEPITTKTVALSHNKDVDILAKAVERKEWKAIMERQRVARGWKSLGV